MPTRWPASCDTFSSLLLASVLLPASALFPASAVSPALSSSASASSPLAAFAFLAVGRDLRLPCHFCPCRFSRLWRCRSPWSPLDRLAMLGGLFFLLGGARLPSFAGGLEGAPPPLRVTARRRRLRRHRNDQRRSRSAARWRQPANSAQSFTVLGKMARSALRSAIACALCCGPAVATSSSRSLPRSRANFSRQDLRPTSRRCCRPAQRRFASRSVRS